MKPIIHGEVKLGDFILSFEESGSRVQSENLFTLAWRRGPEPAPPLGNVRSKAADVYSLGMCTMLAITSSLPWGGHSGAVIRRFHRKKEAMPKLDKMTTEQWTLVKGIRAYEPPERMPLANTIDQLKVVIEEEEIAEMFKTKVRIGAS
jgi:hypothetical protein